MTSVPKKTLLKALAFKGEARLPPIYFYNPAEPYLPTLLNGFITDTLSIKNQPVSDIYFIGEAKSPPLNFTFRCLAREWEVKDNILIYSKPFGKLVKGEMHYEDEALKPIIFDSTINAISISPEGETPRWALYVSTFKGIYEIRFSEDKPVIRRLLSTSACGCIGVTTLERNMDNIPAGTQVCIIPTKVGVYLYTESGGEALTPHKPDILKDIPCVHLAMKVDDYGQYLLLLTAPIK